MSSTICQRFSQNAWKKDLCSNCFKSKEEHKSLQNDMKPLKLPIKNAQPIKSIIKSRVTKKAATKGKVSFPKELSQVIGFGGEWSDADNASDSDAETVSPPTTPEEIAKEIDELEQELVKLTKVNTDYNMSNENLLKDTADVTDASVKLRSYAPLQLGTPMKDSDGRKQTLKISVMPFGGPVTTNKVNDIKQKFSSIDEAVTNKPPVVLKTIIKSTGVEYVEEQMKPEKSTNERKEVEPKETGAAKNVEKSLIEEINETLEKNKNKEKENGKSENKLKLEVKKNASDTKRSISRHTPIIKDQAKPKISVFPKFSDTDSNQSDTENSSSGYYDVVEAANTYENLPDDYSTALAAELNAEAINNEVNLEIRNKNKSSFFSNHLISEMFSTNKDRKNSRTYNFMSKITSDGLIVTKASSDDALDSTGSSFDYATSSDEEMSSINRSESDSGIGICVTTTEYKQNDDKTKGQNTDYEDIQVQENDKFAIDKSRELAGEPDGSADPDGGSVAEAPALPTSPPPVISEPRASFLHRASPKEKPTVPTKPTVNIIKAFVKRTPNSAEQQVITQLQQIMKPYPAIDTVKSPAKPTLTFKQDDNTPKGMKKCRAPDPPSPSTSEERSLSEYEDLKKSNNSIETDVTADESKQKSNEDQYSFLYTRNPTGSISKNTSPVIREKDKRERATINPKFRSLNTFSSQYKDHADKQRPTTPEPSPRKSLSMSQDCLLDADKKKKNKFSIKKFLRMGSNKTTDSIYDKKDGIYGTSEVPQIKPRLVIIHPIDINPMEVEVVKEMGKVNEIVTGKPPAPPLRKGLDLSKPARPPPPKSVELQKKQKMIPAGDPPPLVKEDSVYANLGEIRSAIAPRKPERTASMREREAQLEVARKRLCNKHEMENIDLSSSAQSTLERDSHKTISDCSGNKLSSRLELFERTISEQKLPTSTKQSLLNDGIKSSIQKMNNTIDSYLKDKLNEEPQDLDTDLPKSARNSITSLTAKTTTSNQINSNKVRHSDVELRTNYEPIILNAQRSSLPDNSMNVYGNSVAGGGGGEQNMLRTSNCKSDYGRYQSHSLANIVRAVSRSYCGSEISESDIYSPYSFYGSEAGGGTDVALDLHDNFNGQQQQKPRSTNRLRMRKGRSVVHTNLEDNYGAVVVANHEALAQVLDQLQKTTTVPMPLRPLANSINLRFEDFSILEGVRGVVAGRRAFHPAIWANQTHVTLALSVDCNQMSDLSPITEFCDLVPSHYLPLIPTVEIRMVQATISVLPRMLIDTLQSFGQMLKIRSENLKNQAFGGSTINLVEPNQQTILRNGQSVQNLSTYESLSETEEASSRIPQIPGMPSYDDLLCREVAFVLLQLVNGLKTLQGKGIEELPLSLSNVILCKDLENKDQQARLCVLHGLNSDLAREEEEPMGTLCQCVHTALTDLLPNTKLTATLTKILQKDRSESLSKTKSVLEFALWGPSDVSLSGSSKDRELSLQRWLDLERATILHGLVRSRVELSVYDECHLMFLVRSSAKVMCEASTILSGFVDIAE